MSAKCVSRDQQLKYILECRSSGLTDYQWCIEHGIRPGTFYNWVMKLKRAGSNIPDPVSRLNQKTNKQEIVKLDITSNEVMAENPCEKIEQNACVSLDTARDSVVEIVLPNATIRFVNNTDAMLFKQTLRFLGGELC